MKYQNIIACSQAELGQNLKSIVSDLLSRRLEVEGQTVEIPAGVDLEVKVKLSVEEAGGNLSIKVVWDNPILEEEVVPEED